MTDDYLGRVRDSWNRTADSEWYMSLRTKEAIDAIVADPRSPFPPVATALLSRVLPDVRGKRVLVPSSGDNHAAFAFALMGACVTSCDIAGRQLAHARAIAEDLGLSIDFALEDTMRLDGIESDAYDLVFTSNGVHVWINDLDAMYRNVARVLRPGGLSVMYEVHPFQRPFEGNPGAPVVVKSYADVADKQHWRMQDILNAMAGAGLRILRLEEVCADTDSGNFWFTYDELKDKTPEETRGLGDWRRNPMAAIPIWLMTCAQKG